MNYREIYLRVTKEILLQRNQKELYTSGKNVVGVDLPFEEPRKPDVIVQNDGAQTPLEIVEELERRLYASAAQDPVDNTAYWDQYYKNHLCPEEPSLFAQYVATLVEPGRRMIELGCGNGRDAVYFASRGLDVVALDTSKTAIAELRKKNVRNAEFQCRDFISAEAHPFQQYDYAYSRFTLHAVSQSQERTLLKNLQGSLRIGGKLFIEVRSVNDPLYGKGRQIERNAFFYDNHYRRFIVMEELTDLLEKLGFRIEYAQERTGFSPYANDDPPVIRIVAVKGICKNAPQMGP